VEPSWSATLILPASVASDQLRADLGKMALPPCHMFCQFYVHLPQEPGARRRLSCIMYQRSADLGLGIPFNIASYALLTHMVAKVTDTDAHELIMQLGDAHVYRDHVEALGQQLEREPRAFPTLKWKRDEVPDIDSFEYADFIVEGYAPHAKLAMKMSVGGSTAVESVQVGRSDGADGRRSEGCNWRRGTSGLARIEGLYTCKCSHVHVEMSSSS
jgi:hypothetical protein